MKIVISDANIIWTPDHPALQPYMDLILVVCFNKLSVKNRYNCFLPKYCPVGLGMTGYGKDSPTYRSLEDDADRLNEELGHDDDVLFLADGGPISLFPFLVVSNSNEWNHLHLATMSPWRFEAKHRIKAYNTFIRDYFALSALDSLLFIDSDCILLRADKSMTLPDLIKSTQERFGDYLPRIILQILHRDWNKAYFDFTSMQYRPLEEGYDLNKVVCEQQIARVKMPEKKNSVYSEGTLGDIEQYPYPGRDDYIFQGVESLVPRLDGKNVCKYLKGLRRQFAEANNIPFETEECPSVGPCAGTCAKCDAELKYLMEEIEKIELEKRIYPQNILTKWEV